MLSTSSAESIRETKEILFVDRAQDRSYRLLHDLVLQGGNAEWALSTISFGNEHPPRRLHTIAAGMNFPVQTVDPLVEDQLVLSPRHAVHTCRRVSLEQIETLHQ